MMAEEERPEVPEKDSDAEQLESTAEQPAEPTAEQPAEAKAEQPAEAKAEQPEDAAAEPPEEPAEIAAVAGDGPAQAPQEIEEQRELKTPTDGPSEEEGEEEEEVTPRVKPSVPGAHLEVDIVPEGEDPLGREETYEDLYAIEDEEAEQRGQDEVVEEEEELAAPIATAAIDLASGARYRATGKRKTAIARVTLRPGAGTYLVNGRTLEEHFPRVTLQRSIRQPLETVGYEERMDVIARLHGGGISAQAGALRHGVSRALLEADPNLRGELKRRGFLTRDSRAKERKKAGLKKARKRPQFSKR